MARTPRYSLVLALLIAMLTSAVVRDTYPTAAHAARTNEAPLRLSSTLAGIVDRALHRTGVFWTEALPSLTSAAQRGNAPQRVSVQPMYRLYFAEGFTGHGPQVTFNETLTLLNTSPLTAFGHIEYYLSSGVTSTVAITVPAERSSIEDVTHAVGRDQQVSAVVQTDQPLVAVRTITRSAGTAPLAQSTTTATDTLSRYSYFAEGYTGSSFQEYVEIFNPSNSAAHISLQPSASAGGSPTAPILRVIPPHGRTTVNVSAALPNRSIGLLVQSDIPVAAERTLYWGKGDGSAKFGTAVSTGVVAPAAQWTFPYASVARGDQVFLAAMNPTPLEAHVRFILYGDAGASSTVLTTTVEPGARITVPIQADSIVSSAPFSIVAGSDVPIVCEEAQYFGGSPNSGKHTGSILSGAIQSNVHWVFPGIQSSIFTAGTWYVLNTGMADAHLTATFIDAAAEPSPVRFRAAAGKLTSLSIANTHDLESGSFNSWSSDTPVAIVQVTRGTQPALGMAVGGSTPAS